MEAIKVKNMNFSMNWVLFVMGLACNEGEQDNTLLTRNLGASIGHSGPFDFLICHDWSRAMT